jgi:hypothetical protein
MLESPKRELKPRQIAGISLDPSLAADFKAEAAKRQMSLTKLFQEMWGVYQKTHHGQKA